LKEKILDYLRIGRVQTFPADWLLTLTPFLYGRLNLVQAVLLSIFIWFVHFASFGHNSLMDTAMGYDLKDPNKKHHPLVAGRIQLSEAHNVIHWLLCTLTVYALIFSLKLSPAPLYAVLCIPIWTMFGYAYNSGLSKESVFGFIPISICFTFMGAWGWFLSHETLDTVGYLYLGYVFCTILFQISYSGFKKELLIKERSNILVRLGAKVENGVFKPSKAGIYGVTIKGLNWLIGLLLLLQNFNIIKLLCFIVISAFVFVYLIRLTKPREYIRDRELLDMSLEEVATIYLVVPILLDFLVAALLMVIGLFYFLIVNRILWKAPFPRV
jgi:4-hydroxybenzoate polyprenyltransferase